MIYHDQVWWGHNGSSISITSPRGGVSIETEKEGRQILSRLSVVHALASDAGNYTCQPDLVTAANITVYVVEGKISRKLWGITGTKFLRNLEFGHPSAKPWEINKKH